MQTEAKPRTQTIAREFPKITQQGRTHLRKRIGQHHVATRGVHRAPAAKPSSAA